MVLPGLKHTENHFRWDEVKLNLPGDDEYNPGMPWVYKWDNISKSIAGDATIFLMMIDQPVEQNFIVMMLQ